MIGVITHRPALLERLLNNMLNSTAKIDMKNVFILEDGYTEYTSSIIANFGAVRVECENQLSGIDGLNR